MWKQLTEFELEKQWEYKLIQKEHSLDQKYGKMIQHRSDKLELKRMKEYKRYVKKWLREKKYAIKQLKEKLKIQENKEINKLIATGKTRKKKIRDTTVKYLDLPKEDTSMRILKKKALAAIQKYAKLSRAVWSTKWPMVYLIDQEKWVKLSKNVHGWHVYSKWRFSQMMFFENNIRPISNRWNKQQLDTTAEWRTNLPLEIQLELEAMSKNKLNKHIIHDSSFYQEIINKYDALNEIEENRLQI